MTDDPRQSRLVDTLKAKAMLLIQREREVYALRGARERTAAWLQAFHHLSIELREVALGESMYSVWAGLMVHELHFQTAAVYRFDQGSAEITLLHGQAAAGLEQAVTLDEHTQSALRAQGQGVYNGAQDADLAPLADKLRLQRFVWITFPVGDREGVLLVAGVSVGVATAQVLLTNDDEAPFTMLGRHLAVALRNAKLVAELGATTRELRELFDHMRQAIVTFDAAGKVGGTSSHQAAIVFGREDLEGRSIRDLLYPSAPPFDVDAAAFEEWIEMAFTTPASEWPTCAQYAPREVLVRNRHGATITLDLEFRPLYRDGTPMLLMLLATDVTLERKLVKTVAAQETDHARRLAAMRKLIGGGAQAFLAFVDTAQSRLDRCAALANEDADVLPSASIDELFRQIHTVRSEARAFDLRDLEAEAIRLEEYLEELRAKARSKGYALTPSVRARLVAGLDRARNALDGGREILVAASAAGRSVFDQVTVQRGDLHELVELLRHRNDQLGQLAARLVSVPFGVTAAGVVESAAGWAASADCAATLRVEGRETLIPEALARVLPGVLTHLVRNAIAHGAENVVERILAGKPESLAIRLTAKEVARGVRIVVEDDGRGLDLERLRARADALRTGSDRAPASGADLVFLPGVTTADGATPLAGKGVGLDAVRADLARVHYAVSVGSEAGKFTRFVISPVA